MRSTTATSSDTAAGLRDRIAAGDRQALAEAFTAYRPLVLKVLRQRKRNPADLDDLLQDAFLLLPTCARKCAPSTSLGGCVAAAAIQACHAFDHHKATSGDASRRVHLKSDELERFPDEANPEEAAERRQRVHHLSELVEQIPTRQREALIAREIHGLTTGEVAERFGTTPKTVQNTLGNARDRLEQLAAASPLAEVFAAMPRRGDGSFSGYSRSSRWRRSKAAASVVPAG